MGTPKRGPLVLGNNHVELQVGFWTSTVGDSEDGPKPLRNKCPHADYYKKWEGGVQVGFVYRT